MELTIAELEKKDAVIEIAISGRIDEGGAEKLKAFLADLKLEGVEEVRLNCKGLNYIGSSGIGKILLFYKNLGVRNKRLRMVMVPSHIHELLLELKLQTVFTIEAI